MQPFTQLTIDEINKALESLGLYDHDDKIDAFSHFCQEAKKAEHHDLVWVEL